MSARNRAKVLADLRENFAGLWLQSFVDKFNPPFIDAEEVVAFSIPSLTPSSVGIGGDEQINAIVIDADLHALHNGCACINHINEARLQTLFITLTLSALTVSESLTVYEYPLFRFVNDNLAEYLGSSQQ